MSRLACCFELLSNVGGAVFFLLSVSLSFSGRDVPASDLSRLHLTSVCVSVSGFSFQLLSKAGFAVFFSFMPRCATAATAWLLQNDCFEVKFNVKAAGVMLERQGIRLAVCGFRCLRKCGFVSMQCLETGCEISETLLFSIHSKTGSLDGCWMNHWPIQSEAESNRSKMFNSCLTSWSKSITGIIIILSPTWAVTD